MEKEIAVGEKPKRVNKTFYKTLIFQRENEGDKEKVATFIDKFGKDAKVVTTWGGIIPDLKYSCELEVTDEKDDKNNIFFYKLVRYRIWIDKLAVVRIPLNVVEQEGAVSVTLDGKIVEALTFDCIESTDFEEKVEDLKTYFREKEFQLNGKDAIADFINLYRKNCKDLYEEIKNKTIKSAKKK